LLGEPRGREEFLTEDIIGGSKKATAAFIVLTAISFCHLLNDVLQALLPAIYPLFKRVFDLSFAEVGLLTLTFQATASVLQPLVGHYTDRRPQPNSLPLSMACTLVGMIVLASAPNFLVLLLGAAFLGFGNAIFHPESSRIARLASRGAHGFAQSVFQVGGNIGHSLGPVAAAFVVLPLGQKSIAWFALVALVAMVVLAGLGRWYKNTARVIRTDPASAREAMTLPTPRAEVRHALGILIALIFSKYFYLTSISSFYIFYLSARFNLNIEAAQMYLFVFLAAAAAGTFIGGPLGDRFGRKAVIWISILGVLPFTLALPHVGLTATVILSVLIGLILSSAFPAIVVYAHDLMPGRVGMISGLFFGLAFGAAGLGAAILGVIADWTSIEFVYLLCGFLPLVGLLTIFLPPTESLTAVKDI
jgi:MFS transporter, FSR family, fosmidomycin resistance protein